MLPDPWPRGAPSSLSGAECRRDWGWLHEELAAQPPVATAGVVTRTDPVR